MPRSFLRRWQRLIRDHSDAQPPRNLLLALSGTLLVSSSAILISAIGSERFNNALLTQFFSEKINQIANSLEAETLDWAIWEESDKHLRNQNPDYYAKNYNQYSFARSPFVLSLKPSGAIHSSARWNAASNRHQPLTNRQIEAILTQIPKRDHLKGATFLAWFEGKPFLFSAQPVRPSEQASQPSGRLIFVRRLGMGDGSFKDSPTLNQALGVTHEHYGQPRSRSLNPLAPLDVTVPLQRWQGVMPMQLVITRQPRERLLALRAILLLLAGGGVLIATVQIRSGIQSRHYRLLERRNQRRQSTINRELERRRHHDELTGLLSESGLMHAIQQQIRRFPQFRRALVHIDLDHFSVITNGMGRNLGDQALQAFSRQLQTQLHATASLARIGADAFACSLIGTSEAALRSDVAELNARLNDLNLPVGQQVLNITVSIGAAFMADDQPEQSLQDASVACSVVKLEGGRGYQFFGDSQGTTSSYLAFQQAHQELITAIHDQRIELHAQHAWQLDAGRGYPSTYIELLCRIRDAKTDKPYWHESLIHAANLCGSLPLLDQCVLQLAVENLSTLLDRDSQIDAHNNPIFAINITADTLLAPDFSANLEALLEQHAIPPSLICLEITEQATLRNPGLATTAMKKLRKLGVRFSLDDFGTGATSLGYLRDLPLDYVKIDKSFIRKLHQDKASSLIIQFIVELGREIGFQTIAEGVEELDLLLDLEALGITIAQGYVVSRPQPLLSETQPLFFLQAGRDRIAAHRQASGAGAAPQLRGSRSGAD